MNTDPDIVEFSLQFRGVNSTSTKKLGIQVYDGEMAETMLAPSFFKRFIKDVHTDESSPVLNEWDFPGDTTMEPLRYSAEMIVKP
eukprot:scaffold42271_cov33-Attheya_sp.AAC.4